MQARVEYIILLRKCTLHYCSHMNSNVYGLDDSRTLAEEKKDNKAKIILLILNFRTFTVDSSISSKCTLETNDSMFCYIGISMLLL